MAGGTVHVERARREAKARRTCWDLAGWTLDGYRGASDKHAEAPGGLLAKLKADAAGTTIRVIENEVVELNGWRFFVCTLWTDLAIFVNLGSARSRSWS